MAKDSAMRLVRFLFFLLPILSFCQIQNFQWPLAPVNQQHRISATFDECREDRDHFHNGTDMPLAPGGEVLSIMGGQVTGIGSDWIRVEDFAYVHVNANPALLVGNTVSQGAVLGWTDSYAHIHLNYGGGASGHPTGNPLLPSGITPFVDPYHPRSPIIKFGVDGTNTEYPGNSVSGRFDIIAQAADTTDLLSSIDMNNGVYTIGYALHTADTSQILEGPFFWFEANQLYSNSHINTVYAPGSNTSVYRIKVTNRITANGYIDADLYEPGPYVVSVMSSDTRDNWDTTYVRVNFSDIDLLPPAKPELTYVGPNAEGDLLIQWEPSYDSDLLGYHLEFSFNGTSWSSNHGPDILTAGMSSFVVSGFPQNSYIQFRMKAVDNAAIPNVSEYSDTYAVLLNSAYPQYLVVDGFDRTNGSWTEPQHNFATYYSAALDDSGHDLAIASASNEWVISNGTELDRFSAMIWFVGDDSRTDETFSDLEQERISDFIASGGHFMASGAEIGYDLSAGSAADQQFLTDVLHLNYAGDNGGSTTISGVAPHFSGIAFDYGSAPYIEDWPDHFSPSTGGEITLKYGSNLNAAIGHRSSSGNTFVMGFAFETIDTETHRTELMSKILDYFSSAVSIDGRQNPISYSVSAIYPNPFNASVQVSYHLDSSGEVQVQIYDLLGRLRFTESFPAPAAGSYQWQWHGQDQNGFPLASGSYFFQLSQHGKPPLTHKLMLLK
jgi:hypothetical protein